MLIERLFNSTPLSFELRQLCDQLQSSNSSDLVGLSEVSRLFVDDESLWNALKNTFRTDFQRLNKLLLRIHYTRDAQLTVSQRHNIVKCLTIGYLLTNDVRYFNEFLFFRNNSFSDYLDICLHHFRSCLTDGRHHLCPTADRRRVERFIASLNATKHERAGQLDLPAKGDCRVALLGNPIGFTSIYASLRTRGIKCDCFHLPEFQSKDRLSYGRSGLRRWLWRNSTVARAYLRALGYEQPFVTLPDKPSSPRLTAVLREHRIDLALHRLHFIIRKNLIDCVGVGILNDHVGVLPFVRGWSTIEYALLFGFPVGATVHFVDEGVDTGPIIQIFILEPGPVGETLAELKTRLCAGGEKRLLHTIDYLLEHRPAPIPNTAGLGLQYFLMHPELDRYVEHLVSLESME